MAMANKCSNVSTNPTSNNVVPVVLDERMPKEVLSVIPKKKQDALKWYGWGYKDTQFYVADGLICFKGDRYPLDGSVLPIATEWFNNKFDIQVTTNIPYPEMPLQFPEPTFNNEFMQELQASGISYSKQGEDRLIRCHGQTIFDIYYLWHNAYKRIPDLVAWPSCHAEVKQIIAVAHKHNVVVIPYGGGTSVSGGVTCPQEEKRMICVLDTSQMNRMLWLNRDNLTACFESGIVGQDLDRELQKIGLTVGHAPDSYEFSTLGGWVATRASGMKKNAYGNIEDLLVSVKMVTAAHGVLERECVAPRISCGPDFNQIILGSEGTLGVVTEVVLKVRPLPAVKRYGSFIFSDFELGVQFMREVARRRCQPASVRLMDNEQFTTGQSLRPVQGWVSNFVEKLKMLYVSHYKCWDLTNICAVTLVFEGELADVQRQEAIIYEISKQFKGVSGGEEKGERGYILTFVIAYIRDFALSQEVIAESFETSVPWDRCSILCRNVKRRVAVECQRKNVNHFMISCRVTQTYDVGACVYFYFGFKLTGILNPVETYHSIEESAREEILANGGSISHHHGVGKIRSKWYKQTVSNAGNALYLATKRELDPKNIFATGNLLPEISTESKLSELTTTPPTIKESLTAIVKAKL